MEIEFKSCKWYSGRQDRGSRRLNVEAPKHEKMEKLTVMDVCRVLQELPRWSLKSIFKTVFGLCMIKCIVTERAVKRKSVIFQLRITRFFF